MSILCTGTMPVIGRLIATLLTVVLGCIVYGHLFYRSLISEGYSNLACAANGLLCTQFPAVVPGSDHGSRHVTEHVTGHSSGHDVGHGTEHRLDTINRSLYQVHDALLAKSGRVKKIAFGTGYWGKVSRWKNVFKRVIDGGCPVSSCTVSFDMKGADAVVFNAPDLNEKFDLPKKKNPAQIWVWFSVEPPPVLDHQSSHFWSFYDVFDWTMSYRLDSDVVVLYGSTMPTDPTPAPPPRNRWLEKRSKQQKTSSDHAQLNVTKKRSRRTSTPPREEVLASWMVSNCKTPSGRENYVKEMQKSIAVDIYGDCGPKKCGNRETVSNIEMNRKTNVTDKCLKVMENYHFYLSFESALCKDYVTEKFYKVLKLDVVPVVFGSANYTALAPPNSFINALDFASPKALSEYLKKVAASEALYNSFFEWKTKFRVEVGHPFSALVCDLCAKLQGEDTNKEAMIPSPTVDIPRSFNTSAQHRSSDWKDLPEIDPSEKSRTVTELEQPRTGAGSEEPWTVARPEHFRTAPRTEARPELLNPEARHRTLEKWFSDVAHCVTWTRDGLKPGPRDTSKISWGEFY